MLYHFGGARLLTSRLARTLAPPKIQIDTIPSSSARSWLAGVWLTAGGHLFSGAGSDWGRQMNRPARHHELAFPLVMNCPGPFPRRVNPRLDDFEDEEVVF